MRNNWRLQLDGDNAEYICHEDYDDYGYGASHPVSIGDEIECSLNDYPQYGVVIGIIRDYTGRAACYKVWRQEGSRGCFDYIEASGVTLCEPCGSSEWSLGRIGYVFVETDDGRYYHNPETKDVIMW